MTTLANSFEGGTSGTGITAGNSGGTSGTAFDTTGLSGSATLTFDNAHAAHGSLACKVSTGGTSAASYAVWSSFGTVTTAWFRSYLYFTANPPANHRVYAAVNNAGGSLAAAVYVNTSGTITFVDSGGGTIFTTTAAIPLNASFRIEGFVTASATVGQVELKLFTSPDGTSPAETHTSAANLNTSAQIDQAWYGQSDSAANITFWQDDIGLSTTGYPGPAAVSANAGPASGTGAAQQPVPAIGVNAGLASGAGAAQPAGVTASASVAAGLASGSGASRAPQAAVAAAAGLAGGTGAAQGATAAIAVDASLASGAGAAEGAGRAATAGLATGTGTGQAAATLVAVQAQAQAAQALAAALNATAAAVKPFTVGTLTASDAPGGAGGVLTASDQRTGGPGG